MGGRKPRIAFLVDWLKDGYQSAVLRGAAEAAREREAVLIAFPGGVIGSPHQNGLVRNHLFELIDPNKFDGVILLSGSLGNFGGAAALETLAERFSQLPVCSIGVEVSATSSIVVDNGAGIRAAIEHLIDLHGHRKIAFIRGPANNSEAEVRFAAYREVLASRGIEYEENLVTLGDFQKDGGIEAIRILVDERRIPLEEIDAIAGAADMMVIGAREEMTRRKLSGADRVALIGFDDIEQARWLMPPLASVKQPLEEQGREAVCLVLRQASTGVEKESIVLRTELITRDSCGCLTDGRNAVPSRLGSVRVSVSSALIQRREILLAEMFRTSRGLYGPAGKGWAEAWLNALGAEMGGKPGEFLPMLAGQLARLIAAEVNVNLAHALLTIIRREMIEAASEDPKALRQLSDLFDNARLLVSSACERAQAMVRLSTEAWTRALSGAATRLSGKRDPEALATAAYAELPALGINNFYLARYVGGSIKKAKLVAGYGPGGLLENAASIEEYDSSNLLPPALIPPEKNVQLVLQPLLDADRPLGFAIFEVGECEGYAYEVLRELLSTCLLEAGEIP